MRVTSIIGLMVFAGLLVREVGGEIEGRWFPVTQNTVISQIDPVMGTRSRIWGSFEIIRDCEFRGLEFYLTNGSKSVLVDLDFEEPSRVRGPGHVGFGPWLVHLTQDQLENRSYAVAYHRCHPLWLTETRFYPSEVVE